MLPPDDQGLAARFHEAFRFVRMPLFTALSGWVYALRSPTFRTPLDFLRRRARRLLVPTLAMGLAMLFIAVDPPRIAWPASAAEAFTELVAPRPHIWFVQALFAISILTFALDRAGALASARSATLACALALLLPITTSGSALPWLGSTTPVGGAIQLLGYFLLGVAAQRYGARLELRGTDAVGTALVVLGLVAQQLAWQGTLAIDIAKGSPLSLVVGVPAVLLLLRHRRAVPLLTWLGPFAYAIYLYHVDGIELVRRLLDATRPEIDPTLRFLVMFPVALLLPVLLQRLFVRWRLTRTLFLGMR